MSEQHDSTPKAGSENELFDDPEQLNEDDLAEDELESEGGSALVAAKEEISNLNDRVLRLAAELENTRRRAERDKVDAGKYAISGFARDLISALDNFERALHAAGDSEDPSVKSLVDGLRMTEKELLSTLGRHGVHRVSPAREKFDPNLHQAVAQVPHPDIPKDHVVDVAQPGFTIGERVLRAAMVTVSSGPGQTGPSNDEDPGGELPPRVDTTV
ncbi:nucleotide exchange factor GrpE [Hyphococcus flavus]|uniref:Protein GrpE n=1 Tax=Hyphococcus flavus TaxID=1866326 RepID=A0AAE9ZDD1_9PROT|nr:nucleotide exchange factor GrpE [Hyphococcus flavus]WDI32963.1 nucleotide exchange factor GrpE [Hyphococcus flavus]